MRAYPGIMGSGKGRFKQDHGGFYLLHVMLSALCVVIIAAVLVEASDAPDATLKGLIDEALKNSPEIKASEMRAAAAGYRVPQVKSLPDPMVSVGYQNEGFERYTYGQEQGAQWMYSATQTFPFPGKLSLKGEAAAKEADALREMHRNTRAKTIQRIKELYYDLFFAYKSIDLIRERTDLYDVLEQAALGRYSSGRGAQQDVLMAQTEKYMLLEREAMLKQKVQALKAMLNSTVGRDVSSPLSRPAVTEPTNYGLSQSEIVALVLAESPDVLTKQQRIHAAEARVKFAKKDYLPDFSITGSYFDRKGMFLDMWSLTVGMNIPLFAATKQKQAVHEAEAMLAEAHSELQATKLIVASTVQDYVSMLRTTETLMDLYRNSLIPKSRQDIEAALAAYGTGKIEAFSVITRLKSLVEFETLYWGQFAEREKTIAKIEALIGSVGK